MTHTTAGAFCIAVLAACTAEDKAPDQKLATATPNVVSLSATEYAFQAPDTIAAGWTTLPPGQSRPGGPLRAHRATGGRKDGAGAGGRIRGGDPHLRAAAEVGDALRRPGRRRSRGYLQRDAVPRARKLRVDLPRRGQRWEPALREGRVQALRRPRPRVRLWPTEPQRPRRTWWSVSWIFRSRSMPPLQAGRHTIRVENAGVEPHDLVRDEARAREDGRGRADRAEPGARAADRPGGGAATVAGEPGDGSGRHRGDRAGDGSFLRGRLDAG